MNRDEALKRVCPKCGARRGRGCVTLRGERRVQVHLERYGITRAKTPKPEPRSYAMNEDAVWKSCRQMGEFYGEVLFAVCRNLVRDAELQPESPIEEMMLAGLASINFVDPCVTVAGHRMEYIPAGLNYSAIIHLQREFGRYRTDFAIEVTHRANDQQNLAWVIVECDGHQFHERTPFQAARDKARDRYFNTLGHTVLRFTGSEIHADTAQCVGEVYKAIVNAVHRMRGHD